MTVSVSSSPSRTLQHSGNRRRGQQAPGGLDVGARISPREDRLDPHALGLQILERCAACGPGTAAPGRRDRVWVTAVWSAFARITSRLPVRSPRLWRLVSDRRVLGGAFPQAQRVFAACLIDAQGDDDAVPADLDPVDQ